MTATTTTTITTYVSYDDGIVSSLKLVSIGDIRLLTVVNLLTGVFTEMYEYNVKYLHPRSLKTRRNLMNL